MAASTKGTPVEPSFHRLRGERWVGFIEGSEKGVGGLGHGKMDASWKL